MNTPESKSKPSEEEPSSDGSSTSDAHDEAVEDADSDIVELQFADEETQADSQAVEDEKAEQLQHSSQVWTHAGFLLLAVFVVTMSISMRVPGEERVYLPGLNEPLPGMCMSKNISGVDCPGCGLTRSFISLGHGQIIRAWQFNPSGLALYLFVIAQIPWRVIQLLRLKLGYGELWVGKFNWLLWLIAGFMFVQWLVRLIAW